MIYNNILVSGRKHNEWICITKWSSGQQPMYINYQYVKEQISFIHLKCFRFKILICEVLYFCIYDTRLYSPYSSHWGAHWFHPYSVSFHVRTPVVLACLHITVTHQIMLELYIPSPSHLWFDVFPLTKTLQLLHLCHFIFRPSKSSLSKPTLALSYSAPFRFQLDWFELFLGGGEG